MAELGINTVRVYTMPRRDLLDAAARHGLRVIVGMPWAQHIAFLDDRRLRRQIERDLSAQAFGGAGHEHFHPAQLTRPRQDRLAESFGPEKTAALSRPLLPNEKLRKKSKTVLDWPKTNPIP